MIILNERFARAIQWSQIQKGVETTVLFGNWKIVAVQTTFSVLWLHYLYRLFRQERMIICSAREKMGATQQDEPSCSVACHLCQTLVSSSYHSKQERGWVQARAYRDRDPASWGT